MEGEKNGVEGAERREKSKAIENAPGWDERFGGVPLHLEPTCKCAEPKATSHLTEGQDCLHWRAGDTGWASPVGEATRSIGCRDIKRHKPLRQEENPLAYHPPIIHPLGVIEDSLPAGLQGGHDPAGDWHWPPGRAARHMSPVCRV